MEVKMSTDEISIFDEQRELDNFLANRSERQYTNDSTHDSQRPMIPGLHPHLSTLRDESNGGRSVRRSSVLVRGNVGESEVGANVD